MKRIICLIVLLVFLMALFCSCKSNVGNNDLTSSDITDTVTTSAVQIEIGTTLPDKRTSEVTTTASAENTTQSGSAVTTKQQDSALDSTTNQGNTKTTDKSVTLAQTTASSTATTVTSSTQSSKQTTTFTIPTYDYLPNVPDYGKMLGIDYAGHSGTEDKTTIYYNIADVAIVDPNGESPRNYQFLLEQMGYRSVGTVDILGVKFFGFENDNYNLTVLFGVSASDGKIIITIMNTK